MALLIKHTGETSIVRPKANGKFTLAEMYEYTEAQYIDILPLSTPGVFMVIDEEFALKDDWEKTINIPATRLYKAGRMTKKEKEEYFQKLKESGTIGIKVDSPNPADAIAGNVLIVEEDELN